ncbi:odorant receptor 30a-like isoform X3 [Cylas formicarius]|nr:odorant receptor 30a-like isoform X3 [Cylas formicarius]XP_060533390.1 odorant receptor 30a-like isoform X3 [Cylas formicarius]
MMNIVDRRILNFSKYCMIFVGIWRLRLPIESNTLRKTYEIYSIFVKIYMPLYLLSMCIHFILAVGSKNETLEDLMKEFSYVLVSLITEIVAVLCQKRTFKQIISYVMEEEKDILNSREEETLYQYKRNLNFCIAVNLAVFIFPVCTAASISVENGRIRHQIDRYNSEHNATLDKPFPFALYLYKFDKNNHQIIVMFVERVWQVLVVIRAISTKNIVISCIIFTPSILKRLQIRFRQLSRQEGDTFELLNDLISQHQKVIRYVSELNDSIKYVILLEYLLNSLNVAAVSVQFISNKLAYSPLFYFIYLFVQTFVLGWSANEVKVQSEALSDALYESLWYEQNNRVRRMILYIILRSQKPLTLTIGPFDTMTTASAVRIMKASYSYVSLMVN